MSHSSTQLQNILSQILQRLDELDRKTDDLNRKLDLLFPQYNGNTAPDYGISVAGNMGWDAPGLEMFGRSSAYSLVE